MKKYSPKPIATNMLQPDSIPDQSNENPQRKPISITLNEEELRIINKEAKKRRLARSAFIRTAIFTFLENEKKEKQNVWSVN